MRVAMMQCRHSRPRWKARISKNEMSNWIMVSSVRSRDRCVRILHWTMKIALILGVIFSILG